MSCKNSLSHRIHVAIIMDGNGRWATRRGYLRSVGHGAGIKTVRAIVRAATRRPIDTLTLFAFSVDNWLRPREEVTTLFELMEHYLRAETGPCVERGIRITAIGSREGLGPALRAALDHAERETRAGAQLWLRIALNYSARDAILAAAAHCATTNVRSRRDFACLLSGDGNPVPDVDLLIRTGGERRLSDFMLWECAYAELHFTPVSWPDFTVAHLDEALADFEGRDRRFGRVGAEPALAANQVVPAENWLE